MVYKFRVEMTYDKKLNYIRHLNDLDKIWKIKIFNDGEETVRGLQIKLSLYRILRNHGSVISMRSRLVNVQISMNRIW